MLTILVSLLCAAVPVLSTQGSNFNVSLSTAERYDCGKECYQVLQYTNAADISTLGADFDFDFYTVATNFTNSSRPGDLLKLKPVDPDTLTDISGVSVYRIQYVSEDLDGSLVPVTGYIALPFSVPDTGAFPLVAFAHGTIGLYRGCAVSNGPNLFDYNSWSMLSERGYAIVATDYAGLGLNYTQHKYCSFPAHANDVFHSVTAARHAFGNVISGEWISVGHSQGGGAVWKLAEEVGRLAAVHNHTGNAKYLGTVALAPATKIYDMAQLAAVTILSRPDFHNYSVTSLLPFMAVALRRVFPQYNYTILGDVMKARLGLADLAQTCASAMLGLTFDLTAGELTTLSGSGQSVADEAISIQWQNMTAPANGAKIRGPMLVVQGLNDTAILAETTVRSFQDACNDGNEIQLLLYPKQDHSGVLTAAAPDWLKWIDERFAGVATPGACSNTTKKPFDIDYVRAEREVDLSSFSFN